MPHLVKVHVFSSYLWSGAFYCLEFSHMNSHSENHAATDQDSQESTNAGPVPFRSLRSGPPGIPGIADLKVLFVSLVCDIPEAERFVTTARGQQIAACRKGYGFNFVNVAFQFVTIVFFAQVPQPHFLVTRCGGEEFSVACRKCQRVY